MRIMLCHTSDCLHMMRRLDSEGLCLAAAMQLGRGHLATTCLIWGMRRH